MGRPKPSLATSAPSIHVAYKPTELVVFRGQPQFVPIAGTMLLWAGNSLNDVIINTDNNDYYVLISGRWFRAGSLAGPWSYVPAASCRRSSGGYRRQPAAEVLASVAGTPQAKEALIAIRCRRRRDSAQGGPSFTPVFDGVPQFRPIEGTPLQYVANSPDAIIEVSASSFYALRRGVWFTAHSLAGPWAIATYVPDVIYTIPPAHPSTT